MFSFFNYTASLRFCGGFLLLLFVVLISELGKRFSESLGRFVFCGWLFFD